MTGQHTHTHDPAHKHGHGPGSDHQHGHGHGHNHGHDHGASHDVDWEAIATELIRGAELQVPAYGEAASWLRSLIGDAPVGRVLDVGSGPGVVSCVLAEAFPQAEVVAVDQAEGLLERVRVRAAELGLAERVSIHRADLPDEFGSLPSADVVWTSNVVHHLGDQQAALRDLAGRLRPGGILAVAERGLPLRYLPRDFGIGRPGLQSRLEAVHEELFAEMRAELPGATEVVEDWPAMLACAGLVPAGTRTFLTDVPAPLEPEAREYLHSYLARLRERLADRLSAEDLDTVDRLLDDDAPTGIMWRPDAFFLMATTVHAARSVAAD